MATKVVVDRNVPVQLTFSQLQVGEWYEVTNSSDATLLNAYVVCVETSLNGDKMIAIIGGGYTGGANEVLRPEDHEMAFAPLKSVTIVLDGGQ